MGRCQTSFRVKLMSFLRTVLIALWHKNLMIKKINEKIEIMKKTPAYLSLFVKLEQGATFVICRTKTFLTIVLFVFLKRAKLLD